MRHGLHRDRVDVAQSRCQGLEDVRHDVWGHNQNNQVEQVNDSRASLSAPQYDSSTPFGVGVTLVGCTLTCASSPRRSVSWTV